MGCSLVGEVFITFSVRSKKGLRIFSVIWSLSAIWSLWSVGVDCYEAWESDKEMPKNWLIPIAIAGIAIPLHLVAFESKDGSSHGNGSS